MTNEFSQANQVMPIPGTNELMNQEIETTNDQPGSPSNQPGNIKRLSIIIPA